MQEEKKRLIGTVRLLPSIMLLLSAVLINSCTGELEAQKAPKPDEPINVVLLRIEPKTITKSYTASGILKGSEEALVTAGVAGEIVKFYADEGDSVQAGDLMVQIDPSDYMLELEKARAVEEGKRKAFGRIKELRKRKAVSQAEYDTAEMEFRLAQVALAQAELSLSRTKIKSPISGQVIRRDRIIGDRVVPGVPLFKIVNTELLKLTVAFSGKEIVRLSPNDSAELHVDSFPGESFGGRVSHIRISPDPGVASFPVDIELENRGKLRPGMVARVSLRGETFKDLLLVPTEAIVERMGLHYLFIYENGRAVLRPVEPGGRFGGMSEIKKGLKPGEEIIPIHATTLADGAPVNVIRKETESEEPG